MSKTVISIEHLSKRYELGIIGASSLQRDLNRWWARTRGKPDPYLKIGQQDLSARAGEYIWALDDINFEVKQGETLGIIGRNGAGKSTLLKILSRVTAPTKGKIKIKGRIGSLLEVGTGFHPELTGRENVYLNGAILGMNRAEVDRKFDEIIDFSGVEKFIDTPVKRYSSGMYVRLAFAVAAHLDPDILIVDEVLAVGDTDFQKKCLGKMGDVAYGGRTVVFVSHNLAAIRSLCMNSILIDKGKLEIYGPTEQTLTNYISRSDYYQSGKSSINIKPEDHSHKMEYLRFLRVNFLNQNRELCEKIPYRQPFIIQIEADVLKPIKDCRLGMSIDTSNLTRISTLYNTDCGGELQSFNIGPAKWEFLISENILPPGNYLLGINAMKAASDPTASGEGIEHIPPVIPFTVSDHEEGSPMHNKYNPGLVLISGQWSRFE